MNWQRRLCCGMVCALGITAAAARSAWMRNVPGADRTRTNPYSGRTEAIAAGGKLFANYCAQCHGSDALGRKGRPSLRSREVQRATNGEIFWLLKNGDRRHGMPSWNSLPEPSRWQIVAYIKSLGEGSTSESAGRQEETK
jgi:mono/diheme cytochrome c family protein